MNRWKCILGSSIVSFAFALQGASGEVICWTADASQRIQCAQPDGTDLVNVLHSPGKPMGMAVHREAETLFWVEQEPNRIMSLDLVGTGTPTALVQLGIDVGLRGMAVSTSIDKIYWVEENSATIQRANLDGSEVENLPLPAGSFFDVQVDDVNGVLYWTNGDTIMRGNLDGTSGAPIIGDTDQPYYLALDVAAGKIYWTDFSRKEIGRANLDGSGRDIPAPISGLLARPIGVALNTELGKIYWTLESGAVQRANLDGSNVETVLNGLESTWDITFLASIPDVAPVPAASTWGLIVMAMGLLAVGSAVTTRESAAQDRMG